MVAYTTVSIFGLPVTATKDDVRRFFEEQVSKCEPIISPFVLDPTMGTMTATVTFKCSSENAVHATLDRLKKNNVLKISQPYSKETIGISQSFRHLTTLACRSEHPAFEYVNVFSIEFTMLISSVSYSFMGSMVMPLIPSQRGLVSIRRLGCGHAIFSRIFSIAQHIAVDTWRMDTQQE
jgi:uncharacterized membrane protein